MSSTHVGVDRKSGRPDEALGMSVLNQVQMSGMKNGVVDEKQSIILTEYIISHSPGEIGADRDGKQNYEEQKQHDWEARS